ncbi:MAG: hypothetical protein Q9216_004109 [Gyalolechia sp. 2 TL-2023]
MDNGDTPNSGHVPSSQSPTLSSTISPRGSATVNPVAPSSERTSPSQQARRLQLRNAGFRGQSMPIRRISPILSSSALSSESFSRMGSNENSPHNVEKRQLYGEDLPPTSVNILQELQNSARRKRHPARRSIGEIFQDDTATVVGDGDCGLSWYAEKSNNNSPLGSRDSSAATMGIREVSSNSQTPPPLSSPLTKQARARKVNRVHQRSTSAEAAKYIEHLESQLAAMNTKLDSLMSPSAHKIRAAKLRTLTSEARSLRQQVSDWEQKFDEKVKDERHQLATVEMSLTARLQALEDEVEAKDNRVRGLEWEIGNLKSRVKDAEGLEAVNTDLERRIDLLTSLLVQSPTKLDLRSAASSPSKPEPHKRTGRPRSMMPRIPPSPGTMRLSLNTSSDIQLRRSRRSFASVSSGSPTQDVTFSPILGREHSQAIVGLKESRDSSEQCSGSSTFQSPPSSSSRPTSLYSNSSFGAFSWGLPLPPDAEACTKANQKQRRMRRFPSGAASLKPLILPTAAGTPSFAMSPPAQNTSEGSQQRIFSDASLDPTVAFLSRLDFSSPANTPTQTGRKRSSSFVQTEALHALEGCQSTLVDEDDSVSVHSPRSHSEEPLETVEEESSDDKLAKRERPRSLGDELEEVGMLFRNSFDDGLIPFSDQDLAPECSQTESKALQSAAANHGVLSIGPSTPRTLTKCPPSPAELTSCSSNSVASTAAVATPQAYSLFSRLKALILRTKQSPPALARRLIHNAWAIGTAKLGGLGWWLLGLVYKNRGREKNGAADAKTIVEDIPTRSMEWHHFSPGAGESRLPPRHGQNLQSLADCHARRTSDAVFGLLKSDQPTSGPRPSTGSRKLRREPHLSPCPDCQEPSSRRSLRLWFRFLLAIVLAVGIAIKDGPGILLEGCHEANRQSLEAYQVTPQRAQHIPKRAARGDGLGCTHFCA